MSDSRAHRRRQAREEAKRQMARVVGVVTDTGGFAPGSALAKMPPKVEGRHRWVLTCMYACTEEQAANEAAAWAGQVVVPPTLMDHETRVQIGMGCLDCEQALGQIKPGSFCPAGDTWGDG